MLASLQNPPPLRGGGGGEYKHRLTKCKPQIKLYAKHIQILILLTKQLICIHIQSGQ